MNRSRTSKTTGGAARGRRKGEAPLESSAGKRSGVPAGLTEPPFLVDLDAGDEGYLARLVLVAVVVGGVFAAVYIADRAPRPDVCPFPPHRRGIVLRGTGR